MRFRFVAANVAGESRAGFLDADSQEHAQRQLERRGLRVDELAEVEADPELRHVPVAENSSIPPLPPVVTEGRSSWKEALSQINWPKLLGFSLAFGLAFTLIARFVLGRVNARVYSVHVSGNFHLKSKRALDDGYWQRFVLEVMLPDSGLRIDQRGHVFVRGKDGNWVAGPRPSAQPTFTLDAEGNYQLEFALPLGHAPKRGKVILLAPGFDPAELGLTFQSKAEGVLEATADSVILRRPKKAGQTHRNNGKVEKVESTQEIPKVDPEAGEIVE